jgi:outer membrane lipoprotein SlyB
MKKFISVLGLTLGLSLITIGCADKALPQSRVGSISESYTGIVKAVEPVQVHGDGTVTSLLGMVAGGVLGHQIGGGTGKDWQQWAVLWQDP